MILLFLSSIGVLTVFWIIGSCFLLAVKWQMPENRWINVLIGYALISFFGLIWSLFLPLNISVFVFIICLTIYVLLLFRQKLKCYLQNNYNYSIIYIFVISALISMYCVSINKMGHAFDTDLYHANNISWMIEYGSVYGLANIHERLGVTSTWHIVSAIFGHLFLQDRILWLMPVISLTIGIGYFCESCIKNRSIFEIIYVICMMPWFLYMIRLQLYPNLYYDFPALLINAIVILELYKSINIYKNISSIAYLLILVSISFTTKSLSVVTVLFFIFIPFFLLFKYKEVSFKNILHIYCFPFVLAIAWIARNVILTGYPFFPVTLFPLSVDWVVAKENADGLMIAVRGWARWPAAGYQEALEAGIHYWIKPWLERTYNLRGMVLLWIPLVMGLLSWTFVFIKSVSKEKILFFSLSALSVGYWFYFSPDLRFGDAFISIFCATGMAFAAQNFRVFYQIGFKYVHIIIIGCFSLILLYGIHKNIHFTYDSLFSLSPQPSRQLRQHVITNKFSTFTIWVPIENDRCGNSPIPCTPYPNNNIYLRTPGVLKDGFGNIH